jgi:hypothetical protein
MQHAPAVVQSFKVQQQQQMYLLPAGEQVLVVGGGAGPLQRQHDPVCTDNTSAAACADCVQVVLQPLQDGQLSSFTAETLQYMLTSQPQAQLMSAVMTTQVNMLQREVIPSAAWHCKINGTARHAIRAFAHCAVQV